MGTNRPRFPSTASGWENTASDLRLPLLIHPPGQTHRRAAAAKGDGAQTGNGVTQIVGVVSYLHHHPTIRPPAVPRVDPPTAALVRNAPRVGGVYHGTQLIAGTGVARIATQVTNAPGMVTVYHGMRLIAGRRAGATQVTNAASARAYHRTVRNAQTAAPAAQVTNAPETEKSVFHWMRLIAGTTTATPVTNAPVVGV
jgi:hypothetical protein